MELEQETPLVQPGETYASITERISAIALQKTPWGWYVGLALALLLTLPYAAMIALLLLRGTGIWGINIPVGWGFAIVSFVWWIGIGHAGTFISAILLLVDAPWRTSINRFAEAMTLFATLNALLLPLLHLGRPWLFYWMLPYPNNMDIWPQFRSPLLWDMVAVLTYFLVSLLFWYMGMIPDLATLRDRAPWGRKQRIYGLLSLGWVGSARDWNWHQQAYKVLAALLVVLVVSEHSIVGLDFAYSVVPGWHTTILPPLFLVGAFFAGFAMLIVLAVPLRALYGLHDYITDGHLDNLAKLLLAMSLLFALGSLSYLFGDWYGGGFPASYAVLDSLARPLYWLALAGIILLPQLLWWRPLRHNSAALFAIALVAVAALWLERFALITSGLEQDYLPSAWGAFSPTPWDAALLIGSIGVFLTLLFLFIRFLPVISIHEMQELVAEGEAEDEPEQEVQA